MSAPAARVAVYDPRAVVAMVMRQLLAERVPVEVSSAGRAFEAAERLLRTLGVEGVDEVLVEPAAAVLPFQRPVAR